MDKSEEENNKVEITCVLCGTKEITVERKNASPYTDFELMCDGCKLRYDLSRETLHKGLFGNSVIYCPWNCGVRCKPQDFKTHEQYCQKKTLRFLCLLENCTKILPIRDLIQHVHSEHKDHLIILDDTPEYKVPSPISSNRKLILLHDKDHIVNEVYWQHFFLRGSNAFLMIQHVCSYKGQFHENRASLTRFTAAFANEILVCGDVILKDQPPFFSSFFSNVTPISNGKITMTMTDPSALQLPPNLLPEFDCEVCMDFLTFPIRLCNNGHSLCNDCFTKVTRCPKCKTDLSQARNYALEGIVLQINTHCKYHESGCKERPKVDNIKKHMDRCFFRSFTCSKCNLATCYKDIAQHTDCLKFRDLGVAFPIADENGGYQALEKFVFSAFDELFLLFVYTSEDEQEDSDDETEFKTIKGIDFTRYLMAFYVNNFTAIKEIEYYFKLTVSDPISKKSIAFSTKCDLTNFVGVPKDYFADGKALQITLEIYEQG